MRLSVKRNLSVVETRLAGQNPELEFTLVQYLLFSSFRLLRSVEV